MYSINVNIEDNFRKEISDHFKKLSYEDRYLRFCSSLKDEIIDSYVMNINFKTDGVISVIDDSSDLIDKPIIGLLHVSPLDNKTDVEFGISVLKEYRNKGIASLLFGNGILFVKKHNYSTIYMNCLYENKTMQHIVKKHGFNIESNFREVTARLDINSNNIDFNVLNDNLKIFDLAYRSKIHQAEDWLKKDWLNKHSS